MEQKPKYKKEQESRYTARTVAILAELPEFCTTFYDKNQTTFLPKTQYDYMRTMRTFLTYLQQTHPYFNDRELTLSAKKKRFNDQYGLRDEIIYQILKKLKFGFLNWLS